MAVSLVAEPTPAWRLGSDPITDSVHGASASATPTPTRRNATTQFRYVPVTLVRDNRPRDSAMSRSPVPTTYLVPILRATSTDIGAMTRSVRATGATRTQIGRDRKSVV